MAQQKKEGWTRENAPGTTPEGVKVMKGSAVKP